MSTRHPGTFGTGLSIVRLSIGPVAQANLMGRNLSAFLLRLLRAQRYANQWPTIFEFPLHSTLGLLRVHAFKLQLQVT